MSNLIDDNITIQAEYVKGRFSAAGREIANDACRAIAKTIIDGALIGVRGDLVAALLQLLSEAAQ